MNIDMHIHSDHSDGKSSLENILTQVFESKISLFSITDHDLVHDLENIKNLFQQIQQKKFKKAFAIFVPGVELTSLIDSREYHVLHYFPELAFPIGDLQQCPIIYRPLISFIKQNQKKQYPQFILDQTLEIQAQRQKRLQFMAQKYKFDSTKFKGFAGTKTICEFLEKTQRLHIDREQFKKEFQIGVVFETQLCVQILAHPQRYNIKLQQNEGTDSFGSDCHKTTGMGVKVSFEELEHVIQVLIQ